ncbi:MAG: hypothetical protein ACD_75C00408G0003 [uncultured bacterium]|nr:MAG: hypothetical protein ACD_75C00408G0003 [uncultured bacterium]
MHLKSIFIGQYKNLRNLTLSFVGKNGHTGGNYGRRSLLTIELLFHCVSGLDGYFVVDTERTDDFIKFVGDGQKVNFARDIVPTIDVAHFEVFRPIFEFIKSKCPVSGNAGNRR